jgi:hypothetical protein
MAGLRAAPLGRNHSDFQPAIFPSQGNRLVRIRKPGMAFDKLTHFENSSCNKPMYTLSGSLEKPGPLQRLIVFF